MSNKSADIDTSNAATLRAELITAAKERRRSQSKTEKVVLWIVALILAGNLGWTIYAAATRYFDL